ncbi:MAG: hypothetical protein RLY43_1365, partial [Bacteroidota bacterium]
MPGKIVIDNKSIEPIYGTIKSKVGESNTASFQKFYDEYNRGDAEAKQWFYDAVNYYTDFNKDKKYATPDDLYASFYVNPEDKVNYYKTKMEVREAEIK